MTDQPRQLSIFESQFDGRIRRVEIDGVIHFSVLDILEYRGSEGSEKNPSVYWARAKKRLEKQGADEVLTQVLDRRNDANLTELLDRSPGVKRGGKPTPIAPFKFFLRLAQVIEIKEWEYLRNWMAEVAHERMEEMANPALGVQRATARYLKAQQAKGVSAADAMKQLPERLDAMDTFKELMATVQTVCSDGPRYGQLVNVEYQSLFGKMTRDLETILNTKSIRDAIPPLQLQYIKTAEQGCKLALSRMDQMSMVDILDAMRSIAAPLGQHLRDLCDRFGIDHITGESLLEARAL